MIDHTASGDFLNIFPLLQKQDIPNVSKDISNTRGDCDSSNISHFTHHWSVHIPECPFLTVEDFPLDFVSFLVHSENKRGAFSSFQDVHYSCVPPHV